MRIKKGDKVLIISGKNRGKTGKVLDIFPRDFKLIVEGVNIQKRHIRPKKQDEKGQVVEIAAPISVSNTKLICEKCNKATRVGYKIEKGEKFRICKKCKNSLN